MHNYKKIIGCSSLLTLLPIGMAHAESVPSDEEFQYGPEDSTPQFEEKFKYNPADMQQHLAGIYGGLHVGQSRGGIKWTEISSSLNFIETHTGEGPEQDFDGTIGGGHAGFKWKTGDAILGIEASLSEVGLNDSGMLDDATDEDTYTSEVDRLVTFTATAGKKFGDKAIGYFKGGFATGRIKLSISDTTDIASRGYAASSEWHSGWTLGGGIELPIKKNVSIGIEYNRVELNNKVHSLSGKHVITGRTIATAQDVQPDSIDMLAARLNFGFH